MREYGPVKFLFDGDEAFARQYIGVARTELGVTKRLMELSGLPQYARTATLPDGTVIHSYSAFGQDRIRIVPASAAVAPLQISEDVAVPDFSEVGRSAIVAGPERWRRITSGPPRYNHSAVWDTTNHRLLIFGGQPMPVPRQIAVNGQIGWVRWAPSWVREDRRYVVKIITPSSSPEFPNATVEYFYQGVQTVLSQDPVYDPYTAYDPLKLGTTWFDGAGNPLYPQVVNGHAVNTFTPVTGYSSEGGPPYYPGEARSATVVHHEFFPSAHDPHRVVLNSYTGGLYIFSPEGGYDFSNSNLYFFVPRVFCQTDATEWGFNDHNGSYPGIAYFPPSWPHPGEFWVRERESIMSEYTPYHGLNDLWQYTNAGWSRLQDAPFSLYGHTAIWDAPNERMLVSGGFLLGASPVANMDTLQYRNGSWSVIPQVAISPSPLYDSVGKRTFMVDTSTPFNAAIKVDVTFDSGAPSKILPRTPPKYYGQTTTWDNTNRRLFLFGGTDRTNELSGARGFDPTGQFWVYGK